MILEFSTMIKPLQISSTKIDCNQIKINFFFRLLGSIPGPILYGRLIDEACILSSGKCLFYDNYSMSVYLTAVSSVAKLGAVVCFIIALYTSRWCKIPEDFDVDIQVPSRKQTAQEVVGERKLTR